MTTDSPKGPESASAYQPGARDRVARWYRDQWGYHVNNETTLRHADDALEAVRPELERLAAELDLHRERDALTRKALQTDEDGPLQFLALRVRHERDKALAEVSRLTAEVERLRLNYANLDKAADSWRKASQRNADHYRTVSEMLRGMARKVGGYRKAAHDLAEFLEQEELKVSQLRADMSIRQGALNDVLGHDRSSGYYSAVEDVAELKREVSRLREQLAAQQRVWAPEDPTDESARLANALRFVGVVDPDDDCMSVFDTTGEGIKHWVPVDAIALRMLEHMGGVSSSEVEAPRTQEMTQHKVEVKPQGGGWWKAECTECDLANYTRRRAEAEDWKDEHEADTLRPQLQANSKLEQNLELGRPSGSERLAPRSDDSLIAHLRLLVARLKDNVRTGEEKGLPNEIAFDDGWCGALVHAGNELETLLDQYGPNGWDAAAQAARSEATQEFFEEDEPVAEIVKAFDKGVKLSTGRDTMAAPVRVTHIQPCWCGSCPSPSLRKEGEDSD